MIIIIPGLRPWFTHTSQSLSSDQIKDLIIWVSSTTMHLTPKAHSNSFEIFSYYLIFIFSEEIIQYSTTFAALQVQMSWNQAHAPPPCPELSEDAKNTI
jgi:hypothetical protein